MKKFLLALIAIFVLAGCGSDSKGVAEDFIRALYEGDSKTLVDAIDIPDKDRWLYADDKRQTDADGRRRQGGGL
ncbi:membrane lipoprotein lipid attachment site-containing protein [uncultured Campylobacter sp.]|uniref:membrane lipoprotein lipid attachment site-containing protein n=1 Tax=uncultured Campylobacter sp. TaxID=218934 RepID=UPI002623967C|nr:membrane lipoprotein lipid attachment site-containing protein [uncultured Campylobacter sp.]